VPSGAASQRLSGFENGVLHAGHQSCNFRVLEITYLADASAHVEWTDVEAIDAIDGGDFTQILHRDVRLHLREDHYVVCCVGDVVAGVQAIVESPHI